MLIAPGMRGTRRVPRESGWSWWALGSGGRQQAAPVWLWRPTRAHRDP